MRSSSDLASPRRTRFLATFHFWLRAGLIAAFATLAAAGNAAGQSAALPAGTITPLPLTFNSVEGQSFTGIVAAFADSDTVTTANFTGITVLWGDGTSSAGTAQSSGVSSFVFFISATHTYVEAGTHSILVAFHDVADNTDPIFTGSTTTVEDAPLCACPAVTPGSPTQFSGTGGNNVSGGAHTALTVFESAIGGVKNTLPSPQPDGFRTITWDGVKLDGTDFGGDTFVIDANKTVGIPVNRFQGSGLTLRRVYAVSNDGFADVNPGVTGAFPAFSPSNVFAPFNTNTVDLDFVPASPPTTTSAFAGTRGFGAIFVNVQTPNQTSIEYFAGPVILGRYYAPAGPAASPSFLGVLFNQPIVTRVHLTLGSGTIFRFDGTTSASQDRDNSPSGTNVVALDDLAFAEPVPASPSPSTIVSPTVGKPFTGTVGTFIDTDPNGKAADFSATINWGDGHTSPGRVSAAGGGGFAVSGSNTYAAGGDISITFTVQDFDGAQVIGSALARVPPSLVLPAVVR